MGRTQCLNGRFHPRWWRCLRNHRHHHRRWQWCPKGNHENTPFCIHANTRSRDCDPQNCSSSSSVGAVILWVLLALLLLGGGVFGGLFVINIGKKNKGEVVVTSDDE